MSLTDWVGGAFLDVIEPAVNGLPSAGNLGLDATPVAAWLGALDQVIPIGPLLVFVNVLLVAVPAFLVVRLVIWVYRLIPLKFT